MLNIYVFGWEVYFYEHYTRAYENQNQINLIVINIVFINTYDYTTDKYYIMYYTY